jgi:hypothetical protein
MPITIYFDDDSRAEVAWLCDDDWSLRSQVSALDAWLAEPKPPVAAARYIADVGFSPRADAAGGGAAVSPQMMRRMADLGITLFLSEYSAIPPSAHEQAPQKT